MGLTGNLLMDAPPHSTLAELVAKARDRGMWKSIAASIPWLGVNPDKPVNRLARVNQRQKLQKSKKESFLEISLESLIFKQYLNDTVFS